MCQWTPLHQDKRGPHAIKASKNIAAQGAAEKKKPHMRAFNNRALMLLLYGMHA